MYFKNLPKFEYDSVELVDVFRRIAFTEETLNSLDSFIDYVVPDGDTPDKCAFNFYGDASWFWVVLLSNNIISVQGEWPKSQNKIQRKFTDNGFLKGSSLFFHEAHRDFQEGDIIAKAIVCTEGDEGCPDGVTSEVLNYGIVDSWDDNLFKLDVKLKGSEYSIQSGDEIIHMRKTSDAFPILTANGTGCSGDSKLFTVQKSTDLIKGVSKFKYGNMDISPFTQITGGVMENSPPGSTGSPYTPTYSNQGLCGLDKAILYRYMYDGILGNGFEAVEVEQDIYEENYKKRHIKLLNPKLLPDLYDEFRFLMSGNVPRGTTRIIEFKG